MRIKIILAGILISTAIIVVTCDREPLLPPEPEIEYITIAALREMYNSGITTVDTNVYIRGLITLTPEFGNLPDFVAYIQDSTAAICLTVSGINSFAMNSEVKILCRDVTFTLYNGLLQFGDISIADQSELVNLTPAPPQPVSITVDELLAGGHQAEFVSITSVQFKNTGTLSGEKILTDCISEIEVYTRPGAVFSSETIPAGNGTFKGIASVYYSTQLILRDPDELEMNGNLCGVPSYIYVDQDFNTLTTRYTDVSVLQGWKTYSEAGAKSWHSNIASNLTPWIQATAYNSGQGSVITWMIAPQIDLTVATKPYISFESANGWDNGATLELFASTDYTGSSTPWTSSWTKLSFTLPPLSPSGFGKFIPSGTIDLSAFNGTTLYIAWVYKGADPSGTINDNTTTWEVDNVVIAEE